MVEPSTELLRHGNDGGATDDPPDAPARELSMIRYLLRSHFKQACVRALVPSGASGVFHSVISARASR